MCYTATPGDLCKQRMKEQTYFIFLIGIYIYNTYTTIIVLLILVVMWS